MSNPFIGIILGIALFSTYLMILYLLRRLSIKLIVCIYDEFTEVFDIQGNSVVRVPNKIIYDFRKGDPHIIDFGKSLEDEAFRYQGRRVNLRELDLIFDPEASARHFNGVWAAFIPFCCLKARQALSRRRLPLNVSLAAMTSVTAINDRLRQEIRQTNLQWFGDFTIREYSTTELMVRSFLGRFVRIGAKPRIDIQREVEERQDAP